MGMGNTAMSPKHGYAFDGYEHDVRRARKQYPCLGALRPRSGGTGEHASDCTRTIEPGALYVATVQDLYMSETRACIPCALAAGTIRPVAS